LIAQNRGGDAQQATEQLAALYQPLYHDAFADEAKETENIWWARSCAADVFSRLGIAINSEELQILARGADLSEELPWELRVELESLLAFEYARQKQLPQFAAVMLRLVETNTERSLLTIQRILEMGKLDPGLAEKMPEVIAKLSENKAELSPNSQSILLTLEAQTAAARGDLAEAKQRFAELLEKHPRDLAIRMTYAELLGSATETQSLQSALDQWRTIAQFTPARSPEWFQAKYGIALTLFKLDKKQQAREMLVFLKEIPPGWEASALKRDFERLLQATE
jgi:hypothetical protein